MFQTFERYSWPGGKKVILLEIFTLVHPLLQRQHSKKKKKVEEAEMGDAPNK